MTPDELIKGKKYRFKPEAIKRVLNRTLTYTGPELYRGVTHYGFWDDFLKLALWVDPNEVDPAW